ncbi:hypothetical protein DFJ77DRAFT_472283 [Powellomyces hirtus]|nr:hypothetical protein DFJ77DRAFT_472283 [Powellomyces hirtus]
MKFTGTLLLALGLASYASAQYVPGKQCTLTGPVIPSKYRCCLAPATQDSYLNFKRGVAWMNSMGCSSIKADKNRAITASNCDGCGRLKGWQTEAEYQEAN